VDAPHIEPFAWSTVPALQRAGVHTRRELVAAFDVDRLAATLRDLFQLDVEELRASSDPSAELGATPMAEVWFSLGVLTARLQVEAPLAALVVSRVAGKTLRLDSGAKLSPALSGAFAAAAHEVARRVARSAPPRALLDGPPSWQPSWQLGFVVRVSGALYSGCLSASGASEATGEHDPSRLPISAEIATCLPIRVQAIAAACELSAVDIACLEVGDVLLPGSALSDPATLDPMCLWARGAESALYVERSAGQLRLKARASLCPSPAPESPPEARDRPSAGWIDSPVLALIAMGSVTLPAQAWLELQIGEALPAVEALADGQLLHVSGQPYAWGDWVTVEGQLGLCIRGLFPAVAEQRAGALGPASV
jgi:hypothetical protein